MKEKVSREQAIQDLDRFFEFALFDKDEPRSDEDREEMNASIESLIYKITIGKISIDENGYATVHTMCNSLQSVTFNNRPKVTAFRARDKSKEDNAKTLSMIADTLKFAPQKLNLLDYRDLSNIMLVFNFFLV